MFEKVQPYIKLVRRNQNFRRLWLSQVVSNFGDWFGLLAVYALISLYSNSPLLLGLIIVVKMLSLAVSSPIAGYITDRFNRRHLMLLCDGLRALLMLGMLFIISYQTLWLAYAITAVQMVLSAIFRPARTSSIPNVTTEDELVDANILSSATWSIIFAIGMGIGGLATAGLGTDLVFIIDSASYALSAWFIYRAVIPQQSMKQTTSLRKPFEGIKEGFQYIWDKPLIRHPILAKGSFTMFLGGLTYMLILVSENVLLMGSVGIGLLYASRGVGTGIGPVLGRRIFRSEDDWVKAMGFCMMLGGLTYAVVGFTQSLIIMLIFVFIAHAASGASWTMSTVLLQRRSPDYYRGRVFSTEWLLYTLGQSASVLVASTLLDEKVFSLQQLIVGYSIGLLVAGVVWNGTITRYEQAHQEWLHKQSTSEDFTSSEPQIRV